MTRPIVSASDARRLESVLSEAPPDAPVLRLRELLERARVVAPRRVPPDVVTMNSRVCVCYPGDGEAEVFALTYPDADSAGVSVLSPLGAALLAAREGERVEYPGGRVSRQITLERIEYQPERECHFDR